MRRAQARAIEFVLAAAFVAMLILTYSYFSAPAIYSPGAEPYDLEALAGDILDKIQESSQLSDILYELYWGNSTWARNQLIKTLEPLLPPGVKASLAISRYIEDPASGNRYFTDTITINIGTPPTGQDVEKGSAKAIYTGKGLKIYLLVLTLYRTV